MKPLDRAGEHSAEDTDQGQRAEPGAPPCPTISHTQGQHHPSGPRGPDLPVSGETRAGRAACSKFLGCCLLFRESKVVCLGACGSPPGMDSAVTLSTLHRTGGESPQRPCGEVTFGQFTEADPAMSSEEASPRAIPIPTTLGPPPWAPTMHQERQIQGNTPLIRQASKSLGSGPGLENHILLLLQVRRESNGSHLSTLRRPRGVQ